MISGTDKITLINLLEEFSLLCDKYNVKFNRYTQNELMEFLQLYKTYKATKSDPPPF